jgi:hypothetical protein
LWRDLARYACRKKPGDEVFTQSEASLCTRPGMKGGPAALQRVYAASDFFLFPFFSFLF